ncbi:DUF429 domain-containing protein [Halobaculum sp. CBA1158]|uniref:DUF429 domain-containing protein n=1 Tax=Halobaculum sp. CBA1158 TaxID=2904243 RepID=UPI001F25851B|nr:DUF429 domain-containing protein [Halobaculum sp. CBA1158]UIP00915.1 DUF429 domain-containing protein [Halobaculum sp. CBA1158]
MTLAPDVDAVYGLDFSAAATTAGASTWVARCVPRDGALVVEELASAAEFLGLDSTDREDALPALVDHFRGLANGSVAGGDDAAGGGPDVVAGFDFPFGLPAWALREGQTWREFVAATPDRWGALEDVGDPADLFRRVADEADRRGLSERRASDDEHGGQAPAGWRIKTQTYYGISALLRPLVACDGVRVPPVLDADEPTLTVLETYPAAVFDRIDGAVREEYKGSQRRHVERRRRNADALVAAGVSFGDDAARDCAVATDDALDAVAAAHAAARNYPGTSPAEAGDSERREARIYA